MSGVREGSRANRDTAPAELPALNRRRGRKQLAAVLLGSLALTALVAWHARGAHGIDDAQITFVYARSFALGSGLTWNGTRVLGTSSPFLALCLGLLSRGSGVDAASLGVAAGWLAIAALAPLLFLLGRREGWPGAALVAGGAWIVAAPAIHLGGEYPAAIALLIAGAVLLPAGRGGAAGLAIALAGALRAEVLLAAPLLAAAELLRSGRRGAGRTVARAAVVAVAVLSLWLGALAWKTGALVPRTWEAKRAQAESELRVWPRDFSVETVTGVFEGVFPPASSPWFPALLALGGGVLVTRLRQLPSACALTLWGALHLGAVAQLGVPLYAWYLAPVAFSLLLLAGLASAAPGLVPEGARAPARVVVAGLAGLALLPALGPVEQGIAHLRDVREEAYLRVAALADRYPPGTRIAAFEVGFLGWASRQPVLDLLGLVTPEARLDAVRSGRLDLNVRTLDPDLLMVPITAGSLVYATLGDPELFLRGWELDQLDEASALPVAVYRNRRLPGRGEVVDDLLPPLVGSGHLLRKGASGNTGLLAARVAAGASLAIPLPPVAGLELHAAMTGSDAGMTAWLALPGLAPLEVAVARDEWRWNVVPAGDGAGDDLVVRCEGPPASFCFLGQPHLRRAQGPAGAAGSSTG